MKTALFHDGRKATGETAEAALAAARTIAKDGDLFGINTGRRTRFYLVRGSTPYPISARAAANELEMRG